MGKAQAQLSGTREPDSRQIKHEIEITRAQMDRTVDELTSQLNPRRFVNDLLGRFRGGEEGTYLRSGVTSAGKWLLRSIGRHPMPSAVIGTGVVWLVMERKGKREKAREFTYPYEQAEISGEMMMSNEPGFEKTTSPGLGEGMSPGFEASCGMEGEQPITGFAGESESRVEKAKGKVSDAASRAKAKASETAGKISAKASETASKVSEWSRDKYERLTRKGGQAREKLSGQTTRMRRQMQERLETGRERAAELVDEYPLIVGVSAMAVGLVIGLLIPPSRQERRMLGSKASRLREQAEHLVERGKEAVRSTAETVKEEARRQGLTPSELKESIKEVARRAGSAAEQQGLGPQGISERVENVAQEAKETLKQEVRREENRPL